jgi:hypothetical protein
VGLERGPLSLVSITEELLEWKSSGSGSRKPRLTAVGIRCVDHATPSIREKLTLTSPKRGGCSVGILRLRIKAMEFNLVVITPYFVLRSILILSYHLHVDLSMHSHVSHACYTPLSHLPWLTHKTYEAPHYGHTSASMSLKRGKNILSSTLLSDNPHLM